MTAALTRRPALELPLPTPSPGLAGLTPLHRRRLAAAAVAVLLAVVAALGVGVGVSWLGASATATGGPSAPPIVEVVAQPGDTYWGLARQVHRGGDVRSTVDALVAANGGRELRSGDRIVLAL